MDVDPRYASTPASPSIQQMPELAATTPASPLPTTAVVDIMNAPLSLLGCREGSPPAVFLFTAWRIGWWRPCFGKQSFQPAQSVCFIAQRSESCHLDGTAAQEGRASTSRDKSGQRTRGRLPRSPPPPSGRPGDRIPPARPQPRSRFCLPRAAPKRRREADYPPARNDDIRSLHSSIVG